MTLEEFDKKWAVVYGKRYNHKEFMADLAALRKELLGGTEGFDKEGRPND